MTEQVGGVTRLNRANVLADPVTPVVWALLDEAVLRRPVEGAAVMAEQLGHVIQLVDAGRIRVHVMPFGAGLHPMLDSMLTLMWFDDQPPVAYSEGLRMGRLHDAPSVIRDLQHRSDLALSDALSLQDSLVLLRTVAKD
ncbi:DUF5753 domain-containing protein [Streptomyces sp. bgisy022]|uniref:DUF5753 domain-containing protein n=1 Tax=Streptomyces sp. bgisy022 TaxID=3413769 RepID=UPI003D74F711